MADGENKRTCSFVSCPEHSRTAERVAMLEKGMITVEKSMVTAINRLDAMRDLTIAEFKVIREDIMEGILKRHPATVVWIISILTGACCALATALFTHLGR